MIIRTVGNGGCDAPVTSAIMSPEMVGIGQIIAQMPAMPAGDYPVVIRQENLSSNGPIMSVGGTVVASSKPTQGGAL